MTSRYLEDYTVGETIVPASGTLSEEQIVSFARDYDPQAIHIDKAYAENGPYGGLIASGFQTKLVAFRLVYQAGFFGHNRGGRGIDELRWTRAVKAGDTIRTRVTIKSLTPSRTTGHVVADYEVLNQRDETVMTARLNYVVAKRLDAD